MVGFIRGAVGRHLGATAIVVLAIAYGASGAAAANVTINPAFCIDGPGGHVTRPAGSTISIVWGVYVKNKGLAVNYLQTQHTSIAVNGGQPVDLSDAYGEPTIQPDGWITRVLYPTGVTLANPGDSLTFSILVTLDHPFVEVTNGFDGFTPGPPFIWRGNTHFAGTCTVTAV